MLPRPWLSMWLTAGPVLLLCVSNVFMTYAWYGHLKDRTTPLWVAVLVSWGIAFIEYCFAVPANRLGAQTYSLVELKTIQEVVSLTAFALMAALMFGETLHWNHAAAALCMCAAVYFVFKG